MAYGATNAAFLAKRGITGPMEVFEGKGGLMEAITGKFELDWSREDLDRSEDQYQKKYNASSMLRLPWRPLSNFARRSM